MKSQPSIMRLLKQIHEDEAGAVSIETVLIIAAIALPILIFVLTVVWPRIQTFYEDGMDTLEGESTDAASGGAPPV